MNKLIFSFLLPFLFSSFIYSNNQLNLSYRLKYAEGQGESKNYFENYFDINYFFKNGAYLFSQLEYSSPPLIGFKVKNIEDALNIFYLQYNAQKYDITVGNLYLLYGRGLSMHTYQDQAIDFDNSLTGMESIFHLKDNIDVSIVVGSNNFKSRFQPSDLVPNISIENKLLSLNSEWYLDKLNFHYLIMSYQQVYDYSDLETMQSFTNEFGNHLSLVLHDPVDVELTNLEHNLGFDFAYSNIEFYIEKTVVFYDKILAERESGYRNYFSTYFNIFDFNFFYEYKDYFTPYLYSVFSTPPVCFREGASVLISRNLHTINFNNEYGHQFEINRTFNNSLNFILSYSFALHHRENLSDPNLFDIIDESFDSDNLLDYASFEPFKQIYFEFNKWTKDEKFFYKIGYDHYYEISSNKIINASTIPMQYAYKFHKGNSLTFYLELQNKLKENTNDEYNYIYFSPSYNHYGKWTLTSFVDIEEGKDFWLGLDYTYNFKNTSQLSLFLGSQKGGLICANGSCVLQPDFEDGFKVTYLISI